MLTICVLFMDLILPKSPLKIMQNAYYIILGTEKRLDCLLGFPC